MNRRRVGEVLVIVMATATVPAGAAASATSPARHAVGITNITFTKTAVGSDTPRPLPPARAEQLTVDAGALRAVVETDPWRVTFTDAEGRPVLAEATDTGPDPAGVPRSRRLDLLSDSVAAVEPRLRRADRQRRDRLPPTSSRVGDCR
jgi:hypothetical protein